MSPFETIIKVLTGLSSEKSQLKKSGKEISQSPNILSTLQLYEKMKNNPNNNSFSEYRKTGDEE